ncbi:MAG TPA: FHA domain-containing protein [Polyangia bacterium]|nr:FHA domain-containing protein [Polyangia bacterium]
MSEGANARAGVIASNRSTDKMVESGPVASPMAAAIRVGQQQVGFRLVVVHRDGTDGISYNLLGDQIDIGRSEGDLLFEDPHLAPRHARIVASLTGRVLTPLEGRNGVYVRLRGPVDLQDGDYLLVGKQVLKFELLTDAERNLRPALEHGVVVFGTPVRPPWARLRQITPAAVTRDVFHLTRPDLVLGRETADLVFSDDEFMSRRHAQISFRNGRGHVEDLGSSNGTFLRLRGPHGLNSGDLIRMGDELLRFEIG